MDDSVRLFPEHGPSDDQERSLGELHLSESATLGQGKSWMRKQASVDLRQDGLDPVPFCETVKECDPEGAR